MEFVENRVFVRDFGNTTTVWIAQCYERTMSDGIRKYIRALCVRPGERDVSLTFIVLLIIKKKKDVNFRCFNC